MNKVHLSDWTLAAFMQREEERRRKEQTGAAVISPREEPLRSAEPLRSEWTIAALQQRFVALEQRIATLEQVVQAQRINEQAEAAGVAPREETPSRGEPLIAGPALVAPDTDQRAQLVEAKAKIDDVRVDARPAAPKKTRGFGSLVVTALTAGAIGFGAAIYLVPIEKASNFRALAKRGLASILEGHSRQQPLRQTAE
jgi:hypothetical protein